LHPLTEERYFDTIYPALKPSQLFMHDDSTNYIRKVSYYQAEKNMHNGKTNCLQRLKLPHAGITMLIPPTIAQN